MWVIKRSTLLTFAADEPGALQALRHWYRVVRAAQWRSFADVRRLLTTADLVRVASGRSVIVFDIAGNKYRLIAHASYHKQKVYVLRVMTHRKYNWIGGNATYEHSRPATKSSKATSIVPRAGAGVAAAPNSDGG